MIWREVDLGKMVNLDVTFRGHIFSGGTTAPNEEKKKHAVVCCNLKLTTGDV